MSHHKQASDGVWKRYTCPGNLAVSKQPHPFLTNPALLFLKSLPRRNLETAQRLLTFLPQYRGSISGKNIAIGHCCLTVAHSGLNFQGCFGSYLVFQGKGAALRESISFFKLGHCWVINTILSPNRQVTNKKTKTQTNKQNPIPGKSFTMEGGQNQAICLWVSKACSGSQKGLNVEHETKLSRWLVYLYKWKKGTFNNF